MVRLYKSVFLAKNLYMYKKTCRVLGLKSGCFEGLFIVKNGVFLGLVFVYFDIYFGCEFGWKWICIL